MNSILDPAGGPTPATYWRRRAVAFAALAVVLLLMVKACGGDGPELGTNAVEQEVPLVSTYSPTPSATATPVPSVTADPSGSSDPAIGDDPTDLYTPGGMSADPCADPSLAPLTDESGEPLCDGVDAAADPSVTMPPTYGPTASPSPTPKPRTPRPTVSGSPVKAAATPVPTPVPTPAPVVKCAKSVLSVSLKTDRSVYTGKQKPKLYLGVKNSGKTACLVDLGSKALSFTIVSGNDRIWSSDDCQGKGTSDIRLLKPGQTLWARSVWSKVRSAPGCPKGMDTAKPGYYRVEGSAGGVKPSRRAVFQIK